MMKRDNIKSIQNILLNLVENNKHMNSQEVMRNLKAAERMLAESPVGSSPV